MIYLQRYESGRLGREEKAVLLHATVERLPVTYFTYAQLENGELELTRDDLVVGSVEAIRLALGSLGRKLPSPIYYPRILGRFLGRRVFPGSKRDVLLTMIQEQSVFAKPKDDWKTFVGQVFSQESGYSVISSISDDTMLYLSDVVSFVSEHRVYVKNHEVIACCQYDGEEDSTPDMSKVLEAIDILRSEPASPFPSTYAIDWGILDSGETVLVELNDGFSIGKYKGITDREYYEFLKERWNEMLGKS
ncbi:ATP-grasp domain-containing protein [Vibrio harveyi]|uniref:ATP-grasp domain-containing protein n=1 Tax=Vibrio harveyi TaxID=669 RepID=UPI003CF180B4